MNTRHLFFILLISASACSAAATGADQEVLLDEQFENPDSATHFFPPKAGEPFISSLKSGASPVSGWSLDGQVALTYADKIGTKDSGGLSCKLEVAGGVYAQLIIETIAIPNVEKDAVRIAEVVPTLKISFAAKIPDGEELEVTLSPTIPSGSSDDAFANRIVLPNVKGTGSYAAYAFAVKDLPKEKIEGFITVLKNSATGGAGKVSFNLCLTLSKQWPQGKAFQLDDVLVTLEK